MQALLVKYTSTGNTHVGLEINMHFCSTEVLKSRAECYY